MSHDVIVVGARCAGATLATMLAKSGVRVLVVDADPLPSDMPMSTHFITGPGMGVLDAIGVGAKVRARAPASPRCLYRVDRHDAIATARPGREGYCIKRSTLDAMLQDAAANAGAEIRDRTRVVELVRDGDRVAGVVVESPRGRATLRAPLVVGADGRSSTIAKLTGVEEYLGFDMSRAGYWFYFPTPRLWKEDSRYAEIDCFFGFEGDGLRYVFQCDDDQLLMFAAPPMAEGATWKRAYKEKTLEYLRGSDFTRPLVDATEPIGKGMGLVGARFFYRRPVGPGFALVGDAGNFKDYVTGQGMTDAFLGAKRLHAAILEGTAVAYERYWRTRDLETMPLYFHALLFGEVGYNDPFNRLLAEAASRSPEIAQRFADVLARELSPLTAFSPGELVRLVLGAVVRGRFDTVPAFLRAGKRMGEFAKEIERRQALVDALPPSLVRAIDDALAA